MLSIKPSTKEIRDYADRAGCSYLEANNALKKKNLSDAINALPFTPVELKEVLIAMVKEL